MSIISELVKELRNEAQEVRLCSNECESAKLLDRAADTIKMLSEKVRADRPQGEWEDTGKDPDHSHPLTAIWYKCSECGDGTNTKTNYCPNCGAKMKQ